MKKSDVAVFAGRDWAAIAASKEAHWLSERRRRGIPWCLEVAEGLCQQVSQQRSEWPSAEERQADIDTHVRVGEALRRARSEPND